MNELALFAGAGGGLLGGKLLGWRTVCAVEREAYAAQVLAQRQNDGSIEPFPIWSDVCSFDGKPGRGVVDVVSGGFPCQDISAAGKGAGIDGSRSSMWKQMARIIGEVRPRYSFVENSPMLVSRGLAVVISDLAALGYDAKWLCLSAEECGANHKRDRIWILATDTRNGGVGWRKQQSQGIQETNDVAANTLRERWDESQQENGAREDGKGAFCQVTKRTINGFTSDWHEIESRIPRVDDGLAYRVDRLKAIGNGQVPICMATAFQMLMDM